MAMLYKPLAFYRETCVFPPVGLEKPLEIFKPFLLYVIALVRPTYKPNLVKIGSQVMAPPRSGEISQFCDFCSTFFSFFSFPHLAYRSQFWSDLHIGERDQIFPGAEPFCSRKMQIARKNHVFSSEFRQINSYVLRNSL